LWKVNPDHPSLNAKPLAKALYSFRVGLHWRAVATMDGDTYVWVCIGPHSEYDKLGRR
jgi:hypothetical protein